MHAMPLQVYACFAALGVAGSRDSSAVSPDGLHALQQLPASDAATLAVIQQYTAFRQGQVWQDIRADFIAAGLQVTQEDRWVGLESFQGVCEAALSSMICIPWLHDVFSAH